MSKQHTLVQMSHTGGRRNLIINGAMQVAQRGTSTSVGTSGYTFSLDRFSGRATLFKRLTNDVS